MDFTTVAAIGVSSHLIIKEIASKIFDSDLFENWPTFEKCISSTADNLALVLTIEYSVARYFNTPTSHLLKHFDSMIVGTAAATCVLHICRGILAKKLFPNSLFVGQYIAPSEVPRSDHF